MSHCNLKVYILKVRKVIFCPMTGCVFLGWQTYAAGQEQGQGMEIR